MNEDPEDKDLLWEFAGFLKTEIGSFSRSEWKYKSWILDSDERDLYFIPINAKNWEKLMEECCLTNHLSFHSEVESFDMH